MEMGDTLVAVLRSWDGVRTEHLHDLYVRCQDDPGFFIALVDICSSDPDLMKAATWLIKHHYDHGHILTQTVTDRLLSSCNHADNWEARLHLLQLLPYVPLNEDNLTVVEEFVHRCMGDRNTFVRAWSYQGLVELAKHRPALKDEIIELCRIALEQESPAVRARVRQVLRQISD